ncbi:hypothetical protein Tco_1514885 [Tanacetum coccineum]
MTTPVEKRNSNKFCEFHGKVRHNTDVCMHLKRQIEEIIKAGKLTHLIKELKQRGKDQPKAAKKGETSGKDKAMAILMVQPWQKVARQKIIQSFSPDPELLFPLLGEEDGTEGPMIIEAEIGGHFIHPMYVDGGSSSEIMYKHCFKRLYPEVRNQMVPATTPLIGFSGEVIWPMGADIAFFRMVGLELKTSPSQTSPPQAPKKSWWPTELAQLVNGANIAASKNRGCGTLSFHMDEFHGVRKIQAVPSMAHRMLKFPIPGGVLTLQSSRIIPLECMMVSGPKVQSLNVVQAMKERIKVAIHPEYPEQTIAIGLTLTEEGRKALCDLLRHNLDIFAWKPADKTGVLRHIAEHWLNVQEGYSPVRQRKRGQALERSKAIQEEVEKLVDASIMKEVYYHSWLSNPVMVKKHDDSWRMCVDFKDLNKACPKDGYSLPEID